MQTNVISTVRATAPGASYSQAWRAGRFVFTAGQVGADLEGALAATLEEQVERAVDNLEIVLAEAGASLADVVKTTCFLSDVADFARFDAVYRRRFGDPLPARSTVGVTFGGDGTLLFELEAIAVIPGES